MAVMTSRAFDMRPTSSPAGPHLISHAGRDCPACLKTPVLDVLKQHTPGKWVVSPHDKPIMSLRPAGSDPRDAGGNGESPEVRATASVRGSSIAASMSRRRGWL